MAAARTERRENIFTDRKLGIELSGSKRLE
jgi:hypothetical protein